MSLNEMHLDMVSGTAVHCPGTQQRLNRYITATLNTSAESGRFFKVLSVEVFNLRCVSTDVEMQSTFHKRPRMKHTEICASPRCGDQG